MINKLILAQKKVEVRSNNECFIYKLIFYLKDEEN